MVTAAKSAFDPLRYFEGVRTDNHMPAHDPVCLYLETTNRCTLRHRRLDKKIPTPHLKDRIGHMPVKTYKNP